jgi:uncharacterized RDD family membrane protein YckC
LTPVNASLLRRLGAMLYDSLLVLALLMLMTTFFVIAQGGEAVEPYTLPHQLSSLAVVYGFFVFFWSYGGQTLGMRAWRMRLETEGGSIPSFAIASLRFFVAIVSFVALGLGFLWQLWDKDNLTWHDRLSGTRLRYYPKA